MTDSRAPRPSFRRFARDEQGGMTIFSLFMFATCCAIGAIALDLSHFYAARTQLQVAADIAAHTALFTRNRGKNADQAKAAAVANVQISMPKETYGDVIETADIVFGRWEDTDEDGDFAFAPDPTSQSAVMVTTERASTSDNPVQSFLFRIVGVDQMDVRTAAVYITAPDRCGWLQGLFAEGEILPNSDNWFVSNICVHSQDAVGTRNNPKFRDGSRVSAPDLNDLTCKSDCSEFIDARRVYSYDLDQWLGPLEEPTTGTETPRDLLDDVKLALPNWNWIEVTDEEPRRITAADAGNPSMVNGHVNYHNCGSRGGEVELSGTYSKTVLILNNCSVVIKRNEEVTLSDTIIYTTAEGAKTFEVRGSGFTVGNDPNCTGSGAAALLTRGGFTTPSNTSFRNGIVRALGSLHFAAKFGQEGESLNSSGLSIIAGGTINPQSENTFRGCPTNPNGPPLLVNFRLAR